MTGSRVSGLDGPAGANAVPQARRDGARPVWVTCGQLLKPNRGRLSLNKPTWHLNERPARDPSFSAGSETTRTDERRELRARSFVGAVMFDHVGRDNTVQLEAPLADEW